MKKYRNKKKFYRDQLIYKSQPTCDKKRHYANTHEAWSSAVYYSIKYDSLQTIYKCPACLHYHLTSNTTGGDFSHVPAQWQTIFRLIADTTPAEPSFWQRLRKLLV